MHSDFSPTARVSFRPIADIRGADKSTGMKVFNPRPGAWLPLLIIGLPVAGLGIAAVVQDPSGWLVGFASIAFGVGLVGYNATVRLVLTTDEVMLKRYGRIVWHTPLKGTSLVDGRGGQPPILPAYLLCRGPTQVGFVLKVWFGDDAIAELRKALAS
jgi:hypothetical protein